MTTSPKERARLLIDKFSTPVRTSDFHVPEFITGVSCADGSPAYAKILEDETISVAKESALIAVDEIIASRPEPWIGGNAEWELNYLLFPDYTHVSAIDYWGVVKKEIQNL